jgi:signal transduction histidine kinase
MERRVLVTKFSTIAGTLTAMIGLLVLIGWQFDIAILKNPLPGAVSMKANTAAAFLLAGLTLIFLQRSRTTTNLLARVCALIIFAIGFISLCEYLFTWNAGIDEILFRESKDAVATIHPGRLAPNTALNFLLLGFAFFLLTYQKIRNSFLVEFPLVFAISISVIGFVGYATGLVELAGPAAYTRMAIHTAAAFIVLCIGMFSTVYERQRAPISIEQKLFAGLTASAAIIIFISILSVSGIQSLLQASEWIEHTQFVKQQINAVLSDVLDVETGARGYLVASDEKYIEPMIKAKGNLPNLINNLRLQTSDNPHQQEALVLLDQHIKERIEIAEQLYSTQKSKGLEEAISIFATGRGKAMTDSIRVLVAQMLAEEDRLLQIRDVDENNQVNRNQLVVYVSLGAQVLLLAFIFVFMKRDVIGRRNAEEAVQHSNTQLEAANKELEAFSYSVSHDLRAPLRSIDGFSKALLKDYNEKLDDEGKDFLRRVRAASQRMAVLIDDILKLSHIARAEMRRERVDLSTIAREIAAELQKTQPTRRVEFIIADSLVEHGDPQLLRVGIENLLGNSWKYTGKNPAAKIEFGITNHESKRAYYVRDNGVGFDMAYAGKLFGAFQRLHSTAEFEGTGIGLATVQRIIHRHGGRVWAEGKINEGATFYFTL